MRQEKMSKTKRKKTNKRTNEPSFINLVVNSQSYKLEVGREIGQIDAAHTLAQTLRETLGLTGTKISCDNGACGCCTVLINGKAALSCTTLTVDCDQKEIITIEGLGDPVTGQLDPLQQAFMEYNAFQCGFCTPGMIMSAKALLIANPLPTEDEIKEALSGNFCRCISHYQAVRAVKAASGK